MNQKIVKAALTGVNLNTAVLAQIISYVPNPEVAVEMLLGVFEPAPLTDVFYRAKWNTTLRKVTSIDYLGNNVIYTSFTQKKVRAWYVNEGDQAKGIYVTDRPSKYADYGDVTIQGWDYLEGRTETVDAFYKETSLISSTEFSNQLSEWDLLLVPDELPF